MSSGGPLPGWLHPLGRAVEPLYRGVMARRNRRFDRGERVTRFDVPVIAVGNLSVGGSGKTPMCQWLLRDLMARGRRPALVMRGYGARPGERSDEEAEYLDACPGAIVIANPDRTRAIRALLASHDPPDCVVLDDAFQHRFVHRDLDIVLIDATRGTLDDACLPAGWLREPLDSLRRAHLVVLTRTDLVDAASVRRHRERIGRLTPAPVLSAVHAWSGLRRIGGEAPLDELRGRPVVAAAAIGNPDAFVSQLRSRGVDLLGVEIRRDHHDWDRSDFEQLAAMTALHEDALILTTEKDWVKWRRMDLGSLGARFRRPVLAMRFPAGAAPLRVLIDEALGLPLRQPAE